MQQKQTEITQKLINQAAMHEPDAVSAIFAQTYTRVYCIIRALVQDGNVTRDLLRETYVSGIEGLRMLRDPAELTQWMYLTAYTRATLWLRKRSQSLFSRLTIDHTEPQEFDDEYPAEIPEIEMEERVAAALLLDLMRELPDDQRLCTVLYYYERKSINEIARELGISEDTVRSRLNYSKWKIKARVRVLEQNDVNLYGFKTRNAVSFMVFLFHKHEELTAAKEPPKGLLQMIQQDLQQRPVIEPMPDPEEEARKEQEKQARIEKRRKARKRRTRVGIAFALLLLAALVTGLVFLVMHTQEQRAARKAAAAAEAAAEASAGTNDAGADAQNADASAASGTAAAGTAADPATGTAPANSYDFPETTDLPIEERIIGIYTEKAHENWMEIAKAEEDGTYEVTFHAKDSKGKDFSETYQAKTDNTQLIVDSGTDAGTAATLRWSNDYTVSVNETSWFDTEKKVTVGGVYLNSETPLRGGTGVDAYLGSWVCMDDNAVDMTLMMSSGALHMTLYDNNEKKIDHAYVGFEVETGVNGLPSKLRAHISKDADETFWLYPDGTITLHSDGNEYNQKNFQQN
ncbi:MAG: sigma-70 family RNA polymerase sigma factor [Eubacterium sp.]|nr:sigma-70 family RNA polymerase sigma factor [Eubacterium sp.]